MSLTSLVPDLDHFHGRGGRAYPQWLDSVGSQPNVVPGLLDHLSSTLRIQVSGPDLFAYIAGLLGHPGYVDRFRSDLVVPGLRIPLTADADCFARGVELGRRVIWLHTYGERFADPSAGRPPGPPRADRDARPFVTVAIPDTEEEMPETIEFDAAMGVLRVGAGQVSSVTTGMWEYETSGYKVIRRWFAKRKRDPDGKRSSPLDHIVTRSWPPEWSSELVDLLNVLALLIELEPEQNDLLGGIVGGPLITVEDLTDSGVLPVPERGRPAAEKPPKQAQL